MTPAAGNHQGALRTGSGVQESRPGQDPFERTPRDGRSVLDFTHPRGYIPNICSPSDQPSGLRRGFVFWGQASRPVASAFPVRPTYSNTRGVNKIDWLRFDRALYDRCIDRTDDRKGLKQ